MQKTAGIYTLLMVMAAVSSLAQHHHHQQKSDSTTHEQQPTPPFRQQRMEAEHGAMQHDTAHMPPMSHIYSLNLPMNRNGSGTAWLPDASPMYGYMLHSAKWMYMVHGNIFLRYNNQDVNNKGTRGDTKVDAPNWFMIMGQRKVASKGLFHFNAMLSLDPLFGGNGYPLLFQTGETYKGKPLIDRQHPHDLFSELSVSYSHAFTKDFDGFVYLGYPGEPALGPVAFMHRPSALNNPDATLGHHWQDATHITFGVATLGIRYRIFKLDASLFTGREPNEHRYDFDRPRFDSYSYRLTANPHRYLSMQVSRAFIKSPEAINPSENVQRTTASIQHSIPLTGENHFLTSALIWGNNEHDEGHEENSFTIESNLQLDRFAVYGRFENTQKSAGELALEQFEEHTTFNINAVTFGLNYAIIRQWNTNFSIGGQATLYGPATALKPVYGDHPASVEIYMKVSPMLMTPRMAAMKN